jgi:hypothetical protein
MFIIQLLICIQYFNLISMHLPCVQYLQFFLLWCSCDYLYTWMWGLNLHHRKFFMEKSHLEMQWRMWAWVHEGSRWICKVDACTNSYVTKWLFHWYLNKIHGLHMEVGWSRQPFYSSRGSQQVHQFMNACILSNPKVRQTCNEKTMIDHVKKKVKVEWDEL